MWYAMGTSTSGVASPGEEAAPHNRQEPSRGCPERTMASYDPKNERNTPKNVPALEELESGRLVGAIIPMSEKAQVALRDSIEVIDYLLNQDSVTWS